MADPDAAMADYLKNITGRRANAGDARIDIDREKLHCTWCGKKVPKGSRTWCSQACINEWFVRSDPGFARRRVEERDRGVCANCKVDTRRIERIMQKLLEARRGGRWSHYDTDAWPGEPRRRERYETAVFILGIWLGRKISNHQFSSLPHLWEMDHILPVIEGGGGCAMDNLRTLCIPCHHTETAMLAGRRARKGK